MIYSCISDVIRHALTNISLELQSVRYTSDPPYLFDVSKMQIGVVYGSGLFFSKYLAHKPVFEFAALVKNCDSPAKHHAVFGIMRSHDNGKAPFLDEPRKELSLELLYLLPRILSAASESVEKI